MIGTLEQIFASRPRARWLEVLDAADVPSSPVLELHDAVNTEQVRHNESIRSLDQSGHAVNVVACPIRAQEWEAQPAMSAPRLGENTNEVLQSWLGLEPEELESLAQRNVIASATPPA